MGTFTWATGLGMLGFGLLAMAIGGTCFFLIVNKMDRDKKEQEQIKQWEKKYGSK